MVSRVIIHSKNLYCALKWLFFNYNYLRKELESYDYYSIQVYKILFWKNNAKYFKVFDVSGRCFFVKLQSENKVRHEYRVIRYIEDHNLTKMDFYPKIVHSSIGRFSYNIFEELDGVRISRKSILDSNLIACMVDIIVFFNKIQIVHRDIRPHNIIVVDNKIKVIDFEHCSINNLKMKDSPLELNKDFSPKGAKWDDAYSFKKVVDYYVDKDKLRDSSDYQKLLNMVDVNIYEYN